MGLCPSKKDVNLSEMDEKAHKKSFRVGLVLVDGFPLMAYASAVEPLRAANLFANRTLYDIRHLPVNGARSVSSSGAVVRADAYLGEYVDFNLVLVIAGSDVVDLHDRRLESWLRLLVSRGVVVGGVSGGPLVLARAGVMRGYRMTIHWDHVHAVSAEIHKVIVERSLYIQDRDRLTCGGGTAALDMMHAVITQHHGPQFAQRISDWFLHTDIRQGDDAQRSGLAERYNTNHQSLLKALEAMENHIADPLELEQIATLCGLGGRQLNRVFQSELRFSVVNFYTKMRLKKAQQLLRTTSLTISEIAVATGFANGAHLSKRFKRVAGVSPKLYRENNHVVPTINSKQ